jgi:riboflavin kinase/FMN adenylyltransferase
VTGLEVIHAPLHCDLAAAHRGAVAVMGNMDGVHLGHQALVRQAIDFAGDRVPAGLVFEPHPRTVFTPDTPPFLLTKLLTKAAILEGLGLRKLFVLPFVEDLYGQTPEEFVAVTLHQRLGLAGIVTGADFRFGKGRTGDAGGLGELAADVGIEALAVEPVIHADGVKYSSSAVRQALRDGRPEEAAALLGRPWSVTANVEEGARLARTLDFPTANVPLGPYVRPRFGVYVVTADTPRGRFGGVANIGLRPTVEGREERLEVHLFDFDGDLYGQEITVHLHDYLRDERKFDGLPALRAQIVADAAAARQRLEDLPALGSGADRD